MYDVLIIGCGITGAAAAFELSKYKLRLAVLERENDVSVGTTKANSAILHAGYDPEPGTLMARLNVRGVALAEVLCARLDVPYHRCGSFVLALSEEEKPVLEELYRRGCANGVPGLALLGGAEARALEPHLSEAVVAALWAPSAAICSPWEYCLALAETAVQNGAELYRNTEVTGLTRNQTGGASPEQAGGAMSRPSARSWGGPVSPAPTAPAPTWTVHTNRGEFEARFVLNAAGVDAQRVHQLAAPRTFTMCPRRGQYYLLDKSEGGRVSRVIFQCPGRAGKGVLVAPTVHGNLIVGPSAEAVEGDDTAVTAPGLAAVRAAASRSVPDIQFGQTIRSFAGVRAATDRGDFILEEAASGFLDLAGICSPGLSAAPAIAEYAAELLAKAGLALERKDRFLCQRRRVRFRELAEDERAALVKRESAYGRVICRCETVTEGEILSCLRAPIPPVSVDGVKRRVGAGMGRCQGGFCAPRVVELLCRELGLDPGEIVQDRAGSRLLYRQTRTPDFGRGGQPTRAATAPGGPFPDGPDGRPTEGGGGHV